MTEALLTRVASGDSAAVEQLLRRHTNLVWSLARRFCRSAADAEDAVQEIFVEIWRSADRYDPGQGSEATFLATIARRRLIDRVRRKTRRPATETLEDSAVLADEPAPDHVALEDEVARARQAMEQLRPEQREVLEQAFAQGRTHQEIAAAIGIPLGTVKSHARRGLIRLREMLGVQDPDGGGAR